MIDTHAHILPSIDDGATDLRAAIAMARLAVSDGIAAMVATPHCAPWAYRGGTSEIARRVRDLQSHLDQAEIPLRLYPGGEAYFGPELVPDVVAGIVPTINGTPYLLVELPLHGRVLRTDEVWLALRVHGFRAILAHAERYAHLQEDPEVARSLVRQGVLLQINAGSICGVAGARARETAELLIRYDLGHLVASDAHSPDARPPRLAGAVERVARIVGADRARQLVEDVPRAVVDGRPFTPPDPAPIQRKPFWVFW